MLFYNSVSPGHSTSTYSTVSGSDSDPPQSRDDLRMLNVAASNATSQHMSSLAPILPTSSTNAQTPKSGKNIYYLRAIS